MKTILSGNAAIARGAYEAGVQIAAAYPGTPSTDILEEIAAHYADEIYAEWSANEKVALEMALGAAWGGKRALVAMKHVGVNVAADVLMTAAYAGVNAGLVLVSADDPGMHSSQNEQDNRYFAKMAKIPLLEPADSQEAKDFTVLAFDLSERFDTPVLLRSTTRISHGKSVVEMGDRRPLPPRTYQKNPQKYVVIPPYARRRHEMLEARRPQLEAFAETFPGNRIEMGDPAIGIVSSGVAYQYAREVFPEASFLKLGFTYPLPRQLIRRFAQQVQKLYVVEELEPFLEEQLRAMGLSVTGKEILPRTGELSPEIVRQALGKGNGRPAASSSLPQRPPVLCPGCPHRGLFQALRKARATATGDIGCYVLGAFPPLEVLETCICMGASIGIAQGLARTIEGKQKERIVAVVGDSTFIHAGIPGLINAVYNKADITVVIADNCTTAMTGQQDHPASGKTLMGEPTHALDFEALARAVGVEYVATIDPMEIESAVRVLREAMAHPGPAVVVSHRPCVFVDRSQYTGAVAVDPEQCTSCKLCLRLGCPAITLGEEATVVDPNLCVGCELCAKICPQDAFIRIGTRERA